MRPQKIPTPENKMFYSSPLHPAIYNLELNHSSQKFLFCYSIIETNPLKYESDLSPGSLEYTDIYTGFGSCDMLTERGYIDTYTDSGCYDIPTEVDFTMENPETYLECTERLSESSDIQQ